MDKYGYHEVLSVKTTIDKCPISSFKKLYYGVHFHVRISLCFSPCRSWLFHIHVKYFIPSPRIKLMYPGRKGVSWSYHCDLPLKCYGYLLSRTYNLVAEYFSLELFLKFNILGLNTVKSCPDPVLNTVSRWTITLGPGDGEPLVRCNDFIPISKLQMRESQTVAVRMY